MWWHNAFNVITYELCEGFYVFLKKSCKLCLLSL